MTSDVSDIVKALELIHICCETIEDCGGCDRCPLGENCFEYNSLLDSYERITVNEWQALIDFADDITSEESLTFEEMRDRDLLDYYDRKRKGERDERYIEEAYEE